MRILHIVTAFPRTPSDIISPWLVELLKRLQAAGHDVEVLSPAYRGGGNRELSGIPVHRFRYFPARWENLTHDQATPDRVRRSLLYKIMPAFYVLGGMWAAWRLCRRRSYDIIHVHWPLPHALFGWAAKRACGAPMITQWYGVELRWVKSSLPLLKRFLVWALRASDQAVAISSATAREIAELAPVPVRVIPYAVGFSDGAPPPAAALPRRQPDDPFVILFVGSLVERKGVRYLIDALQLLPPQLPARLAIIGDGPERPRLAEQVRRQGLEHRVTLPGRVSEEELRRAYAAAHVLVLPAIVDTRGDTEGLGVVLLEAMTYGVPVVGSNLGGITDIIVDGETGLLVPPEDPRALAASLARLAADPDLAGRLGQAGSRHVLDHFGWPAVTAQWLDCYASALGSADTVASVRPDRSSSVSGLDPGTGA
ncbi:MAG TPA: glycosyltransferase family 4 protein [Gemmatimonadales bacterium]|nr:glycosyltransferase family 4 protein [Gemmatimonadales bacterium]